MVSAQMNRSSQFVDKLVNTMDVISNIPGSIGQTA
jgi:hypothetical protein